MRDACARPRSWRCYRLGSFAIIALACDDADVGKTIVIGVSSDANTLLPIFEESSLDAELNDLLYLGLNSVRWGDGRLEYVVDDPALADGWEFGTDSTSLTYHIRPSAVWSDSEPITAQDVVFTYEAIRRSEIGSAFADFWENIDSVVALSDREVTFYFGRRYPGMLFHTGIGIIPAHVFGASSSDRDALMGHPTVVDPGGRLVVSGPFRPPAPIPGSSAS